MKRTRKPAKQRPDIVPGQHINRPTWEEENGFLSFLTGVRAEAMRFAEKMGFDISTDVPMPRTIDGDPAMPRALGFVAVRRTDLRTGRPYCLYSLIRGKTLHGYIGIYSGKTIRTLRELRPLTEFQKGPSTLYDWLRTLIKASCDKI
jgi:hypothetical protein